MRTVLHRDDASRRRAAVAIAALAAVAAAGLGARRRRNGSPARTAVTVKLPEDEVRRLWQENLPSVVAADPQASVRFASAPGGRGTEIHVELAARLRTARLADELRRFKQIAETGDVVRSEATLGGHGLAEHLRQRAAQPPSQDHARERAPERAR